ncbi:MAG: acyl carrier protein [Hahellaceae bacterium]|nr:acyl carrier protein [Hahellaceae bacterium]
MNVREVVLSLVADTLQLDGTSQWDDETQLLGAIPEFDSMAVVNIITAIEENFGVTVDDDEISADTFENVGALVAFVAAKLQ